MTKRLSKTAQSLLAAAAARPSTGVGVEHGIDRRTRRTFGKRAVEAANLLETLNLVVTHRDGASRMALGAKVYRELIEDNEADLRKLLDKSTGKR